MNTMVPTGLLLVCAVFLPAISCFPSPPIADRDAGLSPAGGDAGPAAWYDGGGNAARDGGHNPSDAGVRLVAPTVDADAACSCGAHGDEWVSSSELELACSCFSIPEEAFSCRRDGDCVLFHNTCMDCLEEPDLAIHREWLECLTDYKALFCAGRRWLHAGHANCCGTCPWDGPEYCPAARCVAGRCSATVLPQCTGFRDPRATEIYAPPYPYTSPTIPGATCGRQ